MKSSMNCILIATICGLLCGPTLQAQQAPDPNEIKIDWSHTLRLSRSTPTLQVVVNPQLIARS